MTREDRSSTSTCPFNTKLLAAGDDDIINNDTTNNDTPGRDKAKEDDLPATYHYYYLERDNRTYKRRRAVADATIDASNFLRTELSLGDLARIPGFLWFAGAKHPATQLHMHIAMGRQIVVADRMELHLLRDQNSIYIKPIPRFLLDPTFWEQHLVCTNGCICQLLQQEAVYDSINGPESTVDQICPRTMRQIAYGFLHSYTCLISSETDFAIAVDKRLLPRKAGDVPVDWCTWKTCARELIKNCKPEDSHSRFTRAELRISRIRLLYRLKGLTFCEPYFDGWNTYSEVFRDNLEWMAVATVFVGLVLTAMSVGLATAGLQENAKFQWASYVFTIFAILGPILAFCIVALGALFNLAKDFPSLLRDASGKLSSDAKV